MPEKLLNETEKTEAQEIQELHFDKPDFSFVPGNHAWVQRGYYLVCTSCDLGHGIFIGPDKLMVGVDEKGLPIMKARKELGMA